MAWLLDAIDVKWFIDNFGEELQAVLDVIINLLKKLFGGADEGKEETDGTVE